MPSRAEVDEFRRALNSLSAAAWREFAPVWERIQYADFPLIREVLAEVWPALIERYGDMSATVAADLFEDWSPGDAATLVRGVDEARAMVRARWAIGSTAAAGNLAMLVDELVKQPARSTMAASARGNGRGYARVPTGAETCAFCLMLASRGYTYETAASAGEMRKFHGDCDCAVVVGDVPGYDPGELYERFAAARRDAGSGSTKKVLAALREREDSH